jgi:uncharacterized protein (TIGR02217 family)
VAVILDNVVLNDVVDYSAISGGPEASTSIISNPNNALTQRNVNRFDKLHRYVIQTALLKPEQLRDLRKFFHCRDGMGRGFLFKDLQEFWFADDGLLTSPVGTPNLFGTGDGSTTVFGLYKTYISGGVTRTRRIIKPISGTIAIWKNDVLQTETTHYSIDYTTGIVTFVAAPANGHTLKATGEFYLPVFFGADFFNVPMNDALTALSWPDMPIIEIPPALFELAV